MKKKTNIRTVIRKMVREEVAMVIQEVITELKQPSLSSQPIAKPQPKKKIIERANYSNNSVLNDVLNETAQNGEWKTMDDGKFNSSKMNEVMSSQYGDLMNSEPNGDQVVASMGVDPNTVDDNLKDVFTRDYREVLKKSEEKSKLKRGM